jgi:hypothetical protein
MTYNEYPRFNIINKLNQTVLQSLKKLEKRNFYYMSYIDVAYFDQLYLDLDDFNSFILHYNTRIFILIVFFLFLVFLIIYFTYIYNDDNIKFNFKSQLKIN